jgi:hypothetical protein
VRNHALKFMRARDHLKQLDAEIGRRIKGDRYTTVLIPDPEPPLHAIWTHGEPLGQDPISLLLGDFLFNVRSGLDLLAYELAEAHTGELSKKVAKDSEFPIFGNEDGKGASAFKRAAAKKLVGVDPAARAFIQQRQPFQRPGETWRDDPLWILYELARVDRHRLLHAAAAYSQGFTVDIAKTRNVSILPGVIESIGGTIEGSTQIGRIRVAPTDPTQEMHMELGPASTAVFVSETPIVGDEEVVPTLTRIFNYIGREIVDPLRKQFL